MWRLSLLLCALGTAGCNVAFGLERTDLVDGAVDAPPDLDKDGVEDSVDNCDLVANLDQADSDGDGFGDACDGCPALATELNHDEDSDFRGDECDVCPGVPDFQLDSDGNGVGNVCSTLASPNLSARVLFDGFVNISQPRWRAGPTSWQTHGDSISPADPLPQGDTGLELVSDTLDTSKWKITVGFASRYEWKDGDVFGVVLANAADRVLFASCLVTCAGTACRNDLTTAAETSGAGIVPSPVMRLLFEIQHYAPTNSDTVLCGHDNVYLGNISTVMPPSVKLYLVTMPDIPATYIDLLE